MAGKVIRVVPLTNYDWSNIGVGVEVVTFVALHVDVSQFRHATLCVRAHNLNIPGDGSVQVQVVPDGHTQQDPSLHFLDADAMQSVTMTASDVVPHYRTLELTAGRIGAMVAVAITATMDTTQSQAMDAKLSVDLVLKD